MVQAKGIPCYEVTYKGEYYCKIGAQKTTPAYELTFRVPASKAEPGEVKSYCIGKALPRLLKANPKKYPGYAGLRTYELVGAVKPLNGAPSLDFAGIFDMMDRGEMEYYIKTMRVPVVPSAIKKDSDLRQVLKAHKETPDTFVYVMDKIIEAQDEMDDFEALNASLGGEEEKEEEPTGDVKAPAKKGKAANAQKVSPSDITEEPPLV